MAEHFAIPIAASGDVRCARARERNLLDALTCLHGKTTLDAAGRLLPPNGERHLHSRLEVATRFADHPEWIRETRAIADRCRFGMDSLEYHFPAYPLEAGEDQNAALARRSWPVLVYACHSNRHAGAWSGFAATSFSNRPITA